MGHCVTAIIAGPPVIELMKDERSLIAADLLDGLRLIPLEDDDMQLLATDFIQPIEGFNYLTQNLMGVCAKYSLNGPLVYLETEYFGGMGNQAAAAFANGELVPPSPVSGQGAINKALRSVGVISTIAGVDEFDFVGLSRYRHTSDWKTVSV